MCAQMTRTIPLLLRRPLLLLLVMASVVSIETSGRFTLRLIADGAISFAFVPFFEVLSLGVVYRHEPREMPFARAVDLFFARQWPWLFWLAAFATLRAVSTPMQAGAPPPIVFDLVLASLVPAAAVSAWIDLRYFRDVLPGRGSAIRSLLLQRGIGWFCTLGYFLGVAAWADVAGRMW
jgi:hypothetical protein